MFENVESFCRPASVREALQLLQDGKGSARIVAGCTDLIVEGDRSVRCLIDLTHAGLNYIRRRGPCWVIGSHTTMAEIEDSRLMRVLAGGLLSRAAATCGAVQIRNMATIGGNMANGSPSADLATPLLVLGAAAVVADLSGEHKIPLAEYLAAARSPEMRNSLLVEIALPEPPHGARCAWSFQKFGRTEVDISVINVAAGLQLDTRGRVEWIRLALGAVAPNPIRMPAAEKLMAGRTLDQALLTEVCDVVANEVCPISDVRASKEYRRELSRVFVGRAIEECAAHTGELLMRTMELRFRLNGEAKVWTIAPGEILLDVLRREGLFGVKRGCETGECGACTILLDGKPVDACLMFAAQAEGREILTIEGIAQGGQLDPVQEAFLDHGAVQCGYCTGGMVLSAKALLARRPNPSEVEVREALAGNLCRCTGYVKPVEAVMAAARSKVKV